MLGKVESTGDVEALRVRGAEILDRGTLEFQVSRAEARRARAGKVDERLRKVYARVAAHAVMGFGGEQPVTAGKIHEVFVLPELHERQELQQPPPAMHAIEALRVFASMQGASVQFAHAGVVPRRDAKTVASIPSFFRASIAHSIETRHSETALETAAPIRPKPGISTRPPRMFRAAPAANATMTTPSCAVMISKYPEVAMAECTRYAAARIRAGT